MIGILLVQKGRERQTEHVATPGGPSGTGPSAAGLPARPLAPPLPRRHQTLIEHDLLDEFRMMIGPLIVGGGKRLVRDDGSGRQLRLVDRQVTATGAILAI
ncbi:MAG TPA: dihydrofolate reductase family protein [Actinomycetes bacterium]|nr:dihydrofolate reductase family protein [Actinomycetes bacterium]